MPDTTIDPESRLLARYRIEARPADIGARAQMLALEQSVEMPLEAVRDARVREHVVARVLDISPAHEAAGAFDVTLALASETIADDPGQLLNMLFGNCSLQPDVALADVELPGELLAALPGPAYGIDGLRAAVGRRRGDRPMTCTALKPQGSTPAQLAQMAYACAQAGIDVIKDDHGIAEQRAAPFAERVPAICDAVARANAARTDGRTLYFPNVSGGPERIAAQLRIAAEHGAGGVLVCPMIVGVGTLVDHIRRAGALPVMAHPALAGHLRIAPALLLGKLFRLFGADASIFPNFGGRFSYSQATCLAIADAARAPLAAHRPCMPVPAGGMRIERVPELRAQFGHDAMLLIGGDLLAGTDLRGRAQTFVDAVLQ